MKSIKCAVCATDNSQLLYKANFSEKDLSDTTFSARRIPDKIHYQIVHCRKCGLVYSNPILNTEVIEKLYKKSKYTYGEYENDLNATYGKYLQKAIKLIPQKQNLLEIGCGNGFFLKEALRLGFKKVWGVEPGKAIVDKADTIIKKQIIIDIFRKGQFKKDYFDVICMFQVLDHLPDPNSILKECNKILKPGGGILCINHNVRSFYAKIFGEKSPIIDIEHTYLYDKITLNKIFSKNNFKTQKIFNVINSYPLSYWIRMFPMNYRIKKILLSIVNKFKLFHVRIGISAGNIGIFCTK